MALNDVVGDDLCDGQVVGRCRLSTTAELVSITQVMNQLEFKCFQAVKPSASEQWAVRCDPQDVGVDQADVEDTPEEVPPPTPTCTPHSIVGPQLIKLVHATHVFVVDAYTHMDRQVDHLVVAARLPHEVLSSVDGGDDENVAFVAPLDEHHPIVIPPLGRLTLPHPYVTQCVRKLPASRTGRPTEIRIGLQQVGRT